METPDSLRSKGFIGGTKQSEYKRTAELFTEICKDKTPYFAIAFLYDSGYNNADLKEIMKHLNPKAA